MDHSDFRCPAVQASQARLARLGRPSDLRLAPFSLCIEVDHNGRGRQKAITAFLFACLVLGFGGLAAGAGIASKSGNDASTPVLLAAGTCTVAGILCMLLANFFAGRITARWIRGRYVNWQQFESLGKPGRVAVEQGLTFSQFKLIQADNGVYWIDAPGRRVVIEGLCCVYVIHAKDTLEISAEGSAVSKAVRITFNIDGALLSLALCDDRFTDHLKAQTTGLRKPGLLGAVEAALGPEAGSA